MTDRIIAMKDGSKLECPSCEGNSFCVVRKVPGLNYRVKCGSCHHETWASIDHAVEEFGEEFADVEISGMTVGLHLGRMYFVERRPGGWSATSGQFNATQIGTRRAALKRVREWIQIQ